MQAYESQALAGVIGDLCHVLGLDENKVHRIDIQPGYVRAEVWEDDVERVPGTLRVRRKATTQGWTYSLPTGHRLRYVEVG